MACFTRRVPAPSIKGSYRGFKPYVREDFEQRCAYCIMKELFAAGTKGFQLDHFRPRVAFPELLNDYYNLYYACYPCNHAKRDIWPSAGDYAAGFRFIDLCREEFHDHFQLRSDGVLVARSSAGRYTLIHLDLNNPHLVELRELLLRLRSEGSDVDPTLPQCID